MHHRPHDASSSACVLPASDSGSALVAWMAWISTHLRASVSKYLVRMCGLPFLPSPPAQFTAWSDHDDGYGHDEYGSVAVCAETVRRRISMSRTAVNTARL